MFSDFRKIFSRAKAAEEPGRAPALDTSAFERPRARETRAAISALEKALANLDELFSPQACDDIIKGLGARWGEAGNLSERYVRLTETYDAIASRSSFYRTLASKGKRSGKEEAQLSGYLEQIESAISQMKFLRAEIVPDARPTGTDASMSAQEAYRALGLTQAASWTEVKQAFRPIARQYHPDTRAGREDPEADAIWTEALKAYKTLERLLR